MALLLLLVVGDRGPVDDVGGLCGGPLNTSSSFCVKRAIPWAAVKEKYQIIKCVS